MFDNKPSTAIWILKCLKKIKTIKWKQRIQMAVLALILNLLSSIFHRRLYWHYFKEWYRIYRLLQQFFSKCSISTPFWNKREPFPLMYVLDIEKKWIDNVQHHTVKIWLLGYSQMISPECTKNEQNKLLFGFLKVTHDNTFHLGISDILKTFYCENFWKYIVL